MIAVNKNRETDAATILRIVHKYGINDVLLMLADIWRFPSKPRSALIYRTLIEAREKIMEADRAKTTAVQISDGSSPASPDVAQAE